MPLLRVLASVSSFTFLIATSLACGSRHTAPDDDLRDAGTIISVATYGACGKSIPLAPRDAGQEGLEAFLQNLEVPVTPGDLTPICVIPRNPIVFFAAHPDDETIGMAGAIRQSIDEGRPVFVELMTHGEASFVKGVLDNGGTDAWHPGRHEYALSTDDFGDARVREFLDAMNRLGVTGVHLGGFTNLKLTPAQVATRIDYWLRLQPQGLSLRGTAGKQDPESLDHRAPHPDHAAVWEALVASKHPDVSGFCIYQAVTGLCSFQSKVNVSKWCAQKRDALEAYKLWDPPAGRYAIALHSTYGLLIDVTDDCTEWTVNP